MKPLLLDTNVVSEIRKRESRIDANVLNWAREVDIESCYLSVITLFELERGVLLLEKKDLEQAAHLGEWLKEIREREFKGRILPFDASAVSKAASLQSSSPRSLLDSFIAATTLEHNMMLATRNTQDFLEFGVSMVNPWEPGSPVTAML